MSEQLRSILQLPLHSRSQDQFGRLLPDVSPNALHHVGSYFWFPVSFFLFIGEQRVFLESDDRNLSSSDILAKFVCFRCSSPGGQVRWAVKCVCVSVFSWCFAVSRPGQRGSVVIACLFTQQEVPVPLHRLITPAATQIQLLTHTPTHTDQHKRPSIDHTLTQQLKPPSAFSLPYWFFCEYFFSSVPFWLISILFRSASFTSHLHSSSSACLYLIRVVQGCQNFLCFIVKTVNLPDEIVYNYKLSFH